MLFCMKAVHLFCSKHTVHVRSLCNMYQQFYLVFNIYPAINFDAFFRKVSSVKLSVRFSVEA